MKKRSSGSSSVLEANGLDDAQQPPSSRALGDLQLNKENEEQTLVPPNHNPNPNPNRDDGLYEIESVRRKRVRKGQLQYLIKWRDWPETANTWEPLENLQSVPDLIDIFEDSLKSGKHRKRKRKHVVHHTQLKKRAERSTTSYSLRHFPVDNPHPQAPISADHVDPATLAIPQQTNANGFAQHDENDYDPKLSELKATTNSEVEVDKLAIHFQQPDAQPNVDYVEPIQSEPCRGAKRRKSGSVKRFWRDRDVGKPVDAQNAIDMPVGAVEPGCTEVAGCLENNSPMKTGDDAKTACNIVKIIKPIGYSSSLSDNIQDVLVTFMAMRSDGKEVMVDNRYLKAFNPLLLINFYELHLRYSPIS